MNAEQDFERRGVLLKEYIECLGQDLLRLDHTVENGQDNKVCFFAEHCRHSDDDDIFSTDCKNNDNRSTST